ncbi:MAG: DNA-3-methyladenine glycosylase [Chloroflexota bacterium]|nr:DNA-3-methyladenine glycosylase [Chloroflexota bacterium]
MTIAVVTGSRFELAWFARPTTEVATDLIGCLLISDLASGRTVGRIVETEAYCGPSDPASHSSWMRTERVAAMARTPGLAYVYRSYGIHAMLNVVAKPDGDTGGILIRAVEPLAGLDLMVTRRGLASIPLLCTGPGRLCQAFGITLDDHGTDLVAGSRIWFEPGTPPAAISASGRIGITRGTEHQWRFFETGSRFVSGRRPGALPR